METRGDRLDHVPCRSLHSLARLYITGRQIKKTASAIVVGYDPRGLSSNTLMKWEFIDGVYGRNGGKRPGSKNLREQFKSMHGHQSANTCKHVLDRKGFGEKAVGTGVQD